MKQIVIVASVLLALTVSADATESQPMGQPSPASAEVSKETAPQPSAGPSAQAEPPAFSPANDGFETPLPYRSARLALSDIGKSYRHYAASLGCDRFAWGTISIDGSKFTLKYLPAGDTLTAWTKMALVTVYSLPGDRGPRDAQAIARTISETEGEYIKFAHVTNDQNYPTANGEITMFLQYTLGRIDGAAALLRTGPSSASLIELQRRTGALSKEDVLKVKVLANPAMPRNAGSSSK